MSTLRAAAAVTRSDRAARPAAPSPPPSRKRTSVRPHPQPARSTLQNSQPGRRTPCAMELGRVWSTSDISPCAPPPRPGFSSWPHKGTAQKCVSPANWAYRSNQRPCGNPKAVRPSMPPCCPSLILWRWAPPRQAHADDQPYLLEFTTCLDRRKTTPTRPPASSPRHHPPAAPTARPRVNGPAAVAGSSDPPAR